jgi:hypothetical protein
MTEMQGISKFSDLALAWESYERLTFDKWIIDVSDCFYKNGLNLKIASNFLGVQPAELQAVLKLAELEDEDLQLLADLKPPNTTWFSLASASTDGLKEAIRALKSEQTEKSPFIIVNEAIRIVEGPSKYERIASLRSEVFEHAAKKAKTYGLLTERDIKALKGWKTRIKTGKTLTPAQMSYADGLLRSLVDGGAIARNSKDKDVDICNEILDSLGYE